MVVLTAGSLPGAGQLMPSIVRPCSCSFLTTLHIGAPEEGLLCSSFSLLLHAFSSLAANRCCLESKVTGAGGRVAGGGQRMVAEIMTSVDIIV
jgi:hypothetical protein